MKKTLIKSAVAGVLAASAPVANAGVSDFNWSGFFTMLDANGAVMMNSSTPVGTRSAPTNQAQTAISGTMSFDTITGAGTATLVPFDFFAGTLPAAAVGINMQAIGDGAGGKGSLVLGNMLFNWNGTNGIPVSLVLDANGFFASQDTNAIAAFGNPWTDGVLDTSDNLVQNAGATPASDGIYVGDNNSTDGNVTGPLGYTGYLGLGPLPMATTAYNTSFGAGCTTGACQGVAVSGVLPLVTDVAPDDNNGTNAGSVPNDKTVNTGGTIGGNPMASGPFQGSSANFNVTSLTGTGSDAGATIAPFCDFDPSGQMCAAPVPVPAAVWLFGSGLLGLVGVARRKKSEV